MIRKLTHIFICCIYLISAPSSAQKLFGNEWINPQQTYLKIPIAQTGFYRITGSELDMLGIPVDKISAHAIQIFRRGQEIAIEATSGSTDHLGPEGYVRFYAEKNEGTSDSALYNSPKTMPHAYYNLYSDTAAYFLTWRLDASIGKRIAQSTLSNPIDSIDYHFQESSQLFNSHYLPGTFYPAGSNFDTGSILSDYDVGEGWSGPEIAENEFFELAFALEDIVKPYFKKAEIEVLLTGWTAGNHAFELWTGAKNNLKRRLSVIELQDYDSAKIRAFLDPDDLISDHKLILTLVPIGKGGHISVSYGSLTYPQKTSFKTVSKQKTVSFPKSEHSLWITPDSDELDFYDISKPTSPRKLKKTGCGIALDSSYKIIAVKQVLNVTGMKPVKFKEIAARDFNYLIISHPLMHLPIDNQDPVQEYARYRASKAGGGYKPMVIHSSEVYDQFNYGDPSPTGLRNLIFWLNKAGSLQFVFLIGRSVDPQKARKLADPRNVDMVPNTGWPGSDIGLAMDPADAESLPIVPIGRINALTSRNVHDYLVKVKAMEAEPVAAAWRKNILHLSGGRSRDELLAFRGNIKSFEKTIKNSGLGALVETISKQNDDPVEEIAAHIPVNMGKSLITLFGHSSLDLTDLDIGNASDPKRFYHNHPYYPAVIVNGCASGSIFYSNQTLSSDWIFTPEKGAVLFLAHTFNGVSTSLKRYTDIFYEVVADSNFTNQSFGNMQREAIKRNLQRNPDIYDRITVQQMNLQGDPAIRIFPAKLPDYLFDSTGISFSDLSGNTLTPSSDSILIRLVVKNNGRYRKEKYQLSLRRMVDDVLYIFEKEKTAMPVADTLYWALPNQPKISDNEEWKFTLDENQLLTEENELNNKLIINSMTIQNHPNTTDHIPPVLFVTVDGRQLANNDVVSNQPLIGIGLLDEHISRDTSAILIWLKRQCNGCTEKRIHLGHAIRKDISGTHSYTELQIPEQLGEGNYVLTIQAMDSLGNGAPVYQIHFRVTADPGLIRLQISPNPSNRWFKLSLHLDGNFPGTDVRLSISNSTGNVVSERTLKAHSGLNEWIWDPGELPSGVYLYQVIFQQNSLPTSFTGVKPMEGRLLWVH